VLDELNSFSVEHISRYDCNSKQLTIFVYCDEDFLCISFVRLGTSCLAHVALFWSNSIKAAPTCQTRHLGLRQKASPTVDKSLGDNTQLDEHQTIKKKE